MKTAWLLLAVALLLTGCQDARGTTTPGNVSVAGVEQASPEEEGADAPVEQPEGETPEAVPPVLIKEAQTLSAETQAPERASALNSAEAKAAALKHAGLTEEAAQFTKVKLEPEEGGQVYQLDFYTSDGSKYDYEIDAETGEVRHYEQEYDSHHDTQTSGGVTIDSASLISEEKAQTIALAMVPGAEAQHIQLELEYEEGRALYEGEIHYSGQAYEFELDAASGAVLHWEAEAAEEEDED